MFRLIITHFETGRRANSTYIYSFIFYEQKRKSIGGHERWYRQYRDRINAS